MTTPLAWTTTTYADHQGRIYEAIQVPWPQIDRLLGRPHRGCSDDDAILVAALLAAGAPAWVATAAGWVDAGGWGLIGPQRDEAAVARPTSARSVGTRQAAAELGLSLARFRVLLAEDRIEGAHKLGRDWAIPSPVRVLPPRARRCPAKTWRPDEEPERHG